MGKKLAKGDMVEVTYLVNGRPPARTRGKVTDIGKDGAITCDVQTRPGVVSSMTCTTDGWPRWAPIEAPEEKPAGGQPTGGAGGGSTDSGGAAGGGTK